MRSELLVEDALRSHVVVMDEGDEAVKCLNTFIQQNSVRSARVTAIGGFRAVTLAWFDPDARKYQEIAINEQVEVVSLVGDVALQTDDVPGLHAHCVVADRSAHAYGGHLLRGIVRPTLEVFVEETPTRLQRRHDAASGLALIQLPAP